MAQPSEDTKKTATSMMSGVGKSFLGGAKKVVSSVGKLFTKKPDSIVPPSQVSNPTEALGEIFKIMKVMDEERKISQEKTNAYIEEQKHEKDRRNEEIIKALTVPKQKKPPKPKKQKKVEEKKEPEKKVEEKKEPEKKVEEKKVETTKKTEDAAKKQVDKESEKAREQADKEAERARKTAEREQAAARKKAEDEAKQQTAKKEESVVTKGTQEATATPVTKPPAIPSTTTTAKVAVGASTLGAAATAIGGAESGGNYNITFGDKLDKKGNVIRGKNMSPEQRFNGRNLTDLTLEEVDTLGKERNKASASTSAMGKYQFMNTVLFGRTDNQGKFRPGLVQQSGLDMKTTKFTPEVQDMLYKMLHEQDIATLRRLGVPVTPGYEYMAHYLGAGGAKAIYERRNTDMTVQQALISAKLPDPVHGKTNEELSTIKASEFESILAGRLNKHGLSPHASNTSGDKMNDMSKTNTDMKKEMNAQQASQNQQNINVVNQNTTEQQNTPPKQKDVNPLLAKGQAK